MSCGTRLGIESFGGEERRYVRQIVIIGMDVDVISIEFDHACNAIVVGTAKMVQEGLPRRWIQHGSFGCHDVVICIVCVGICAAISVGLSSLIPATRTVTRQRRRRLRNPGGSPGGKDGEFIPASHAHVVGVGGGGVFAGGAPRHGKHDLVSGYDALWIE